LKLSPSSIPPLHASSLAECLTAIQPQHRREHLVRSYGISAITVHTITDDIATSSFPLRFGRTEAMPFDARFSAIRRVALFADGGKLPVNAQATTKDISR
jgi:hypothetical protein